jgi:tetratricopeptide (TPR) repeat protein
MGDSTDQDDVRLSPANALPSERARRKQRLISLVTGVGAIFLAFLLVGDRMVGRRSKVEDVYNRGVDLRRQGKLDQAIAAYRAAIKISPGFAEAHNNLGEALHRQGKYEEAIAAFRAAIGLKPNHANAHYNLAISLVAQERLDDALGEFREAIRNKPDHGRAYIGLVAVLEARGKPDEAIALYREAGTQVRALWSLTPGHGM